MAETKKSATPNVTPVSNDSLRTIVQEAIAPLVRRVDTLEEDVQGISQSLDGLTESVTRWRAEEAESISRVAQASARSVDIAMQAQREAAEAKGEMTNIVASALKIHGASIAQTVDVAVTKAMGPLANDVSALKKTTNERLTTQDTVLSGQNTELANIRGGIDGLVLKLTEWQGRPWFKWLMLLGAIVGAAIGAGASAYLTHSGH